MTKMIFVGRKRHDMTEDERFYEDELFTTYEPQLFTNVVATSASASARRPC